MTEAVLSSIADVPELAGDIALCWRRVMYLDGYVDDSGSDPTGVSYVLGGVVMPSGWWKNWKAEWAGVLNSHPAVEYFKASEVWSRDAERKTPFSFLTDDQRKHKVDQLVEVLVSYKPSILTVRMDWATFNRFRADYVLPPEKDDPYFWLYYAMIASGSINITRESNPTPIDWVFDNQNAIGRKVKAYYGAFRSMCTPEVLATLGKEPEFAEEKTTLPLQAADLVAWYRRRKSLDTIFGEQHERIQRVLESLEFASVVEDSHLAHWAIILGVMKKHEATH